MGNPEQHGFPTDAAVGASTADTAATDLAAAETAYATAAEALVQAEADAETARQRLETAREAAKVDKAAPAEADVEPVGTTEESQAAVPTTEQVSLPPEPVQPDVSGL